MSGSIESQQHKDKPFEGIYQTPDSTETQRHKDQQTYKSDLQMRKEREKTSKERWSHVEKEHYGDNQ